MPTFDTAKPVYVTVILEVGTLRITADDRTDTVVDVRPTTESRAADVRAAEQTRVEYASGKLLVKGPRDRSLFGRGSSVDVTIALPEGSHAQVTTSMADLTTEGRLGEVAFKTTSGDVRIARAGSVRANTGYGEVLVDHAEGPVDITTASGAVRLGTVGGTTLVKNSNGTTEIGEATGELRVRSANGSVSIGRAHADVTVRTANGPIEVGEVARGTVVLETGTGRLGIGVREGTAAWLDVRTKSGAVRQALGSAQGPGDSGETVQVRGRTNFGDIVVHRA
ncbi:DUF4097 family beta strand repeat-containing protein [Streptomyces sp. G45]|uniref:DUF4097 family beta strand repeat-containing protein n=1 Tax=Streptomyces sp. G45 TaxID=3406627 RepID=UPI003C175BDC